MNRITKCQMSFGQVTDPITLSLVSLLSSLQPSVNTVPGGIFYLKSLSCLGFLTAIVL